MDRCAQRPAACGPLGFTIRASMPKLDWLTRSEDEKSAAQVPYRLLSTQVAPNPPSMP